MKTIVQEFPAGKNQRVVIRQDITFVKDEQKDAFTVSSECKIGKKWIKVGSISLFLKIEDAVKRATEQAEEHRERPDLIKEQLDRQNAFARELKESLKISFK